MMMIGFSSKIIIEICSIHLSLSLPKINQFIIFFLVLILSVMEYKILRYPKGKGIV